MTPTLAIAIFYSFSNNFGTMIGQNIPKILIIFAALVGLYWGLSKILKGIGGPGTTSWLGSHWSWYDRMTYKPWKGYNRLRSKRWNIDHTA